MQPTDTLGLYIHLPWCIRKCPYCDFNSHALKAELPEADYIDALISDIQFEAPRLTGKIITSIFFGGGTPSLFSDHGIGQLLDAIHGSLSIDPHVEITLEANPGTAELRYLEGYREAGVNRLSLGVQSLDDSHLKQLDRIHSANEAVHAYHKARLAGFENINIDLMFGLPGQSIDAALGDLQQVMALQPEHLSWYQLTIEPNTAFAHTPPELPSNDDVFRMQEAGITQMTDKGYARYEVSAFAQNDKVCRHNLNYWQFGDYLGVGAGAHGKLSEDEPRRYARQRHPKQYLETAGSEAVYQQVDVIPQSDRLFEFLLNRLRLTTPVLANELAPFLPDGHSQLETVLEPAIRRGLIRLSASSLSVTPRGYQLLNEILLLLLPVNEQ